MSRISRTGLTLRAALMLFAFLSGSAGAQRIGRDARDNGAALDHRAALERIVKKLTAQFPRVKGLVASARGNELYLTLEGGGKIRPGTRLSVFRKMGSFKHPVTGEVLGHFEEDLGSAVVTDLRDKFLVARFEPKGKLVPRPGDRVRITAAQIRVALLPIVNKTREKFNQDETLLDFQTLLERTGRFRVFDVDKLRVWLLENRVPLDSILKQRLRDRLSQFVRTDLVLMSELRKLGGRYVLETRLANLTDGTSGEAIAAMINRLPTAIATGRSRLRGRRGGLLLDEGAIRERDQASRLNPNFRVRRGAPRWGIQRSQKLDWVASGLAAGDFDGDKQQEVVLIHDSELNVYRWEKGVLAEEFSYRASAGDRFLTVDSIDLNGDGRPEIYVTNYRHPVLNSFVVGFEKGKYKILKSGLDSFFRVIQGMDGKPILAGQALGLETPYYGNVYEYEWKNGGPVEKKPLPLPRGLTIYGFNYWDVDEDGISEIVEVKRFGRIAVYKTDGSVIHETRRTYGGYSTRFRYDQALTRPEIPDLIHGADADPKFETIRGRLLLRDVTGDRKPDLVVPVNLQRVAYIENLGMGDAEIAALAWDGSVLTEQWRSRKIGGVVADYQFVDLDGDGEEELVAAIVESKLLSLKAGTTRLVVYRLKKG